MYPLLYRRDNSWVTRRSTFLESKTSSWLQLGGEGYPPAFDSSLGFDWLFRNHARWALGGWGRLEEKDWEMKRTGPHVMTFNAPAYDL